MAESGAKGKTTGCMENTAVKKEGCIMTQEDAGIEKSGRKVDSRENAVCVGLR